MHGIESRKKTYVEAVVDIDPDGRQRPLAIYWGDGRCFVVDRVLESRRAASMKVGGHGIRYTVEICGRTKHLWHSDDGRWYVEEIVPGNAGALWRTRSDTSTSKASAMRHSLLNVTFISPASSRLM